MFFFFPSGYQPSYKKNSINLILQNSFYTIQNKHALHQSKIESIFPVFSMFSVSEKSKNQIPYTSRNRPDISFNTENRRPLPEVDPEFPRRWTPTPELGTKSITWQDLCRKLHENERNWTEKGRASLAPPWIRQCLRGSHNLAKVSS